MNLSTFLYAVKLVLAKMKTSKSILFYIFITALVQLFIIVVVLYKIQKYVPVIKFPQTMEININLVKNNKVESKNSVSTNSNITVLSIREKIKLHVLSRGTFNVSLLKIELREAEFNCTSEISISAKCEPYAIVRLSNFPNKEKEKFNCFIQKLRSKLNQADNRDLLQGFKQLKEIIGFHSEQEHPERTINCLKNGYIAVRLGAGLGNQMYL